MNNLCISKFIAPGAVPKFGAIPAAAVPFPFQPRQPRCQAALADAEYIFALPAQDLANELAAKTGRADDTSDGKSDPAIFHTI